MDVTRFTLSDNTSFVETGTDVILVNTETNHYYELDELGAKAWSMFILGDSLENIVESILAEYDVEEEKVKQDLEELQKSCYEHGLICVKD